MDTQGLARQILEQRKKRGISQEELARMADISRNYVSLLERAQARNVSMRIIEKLALALDVPPSQLICQEDERARLIPSALRELGLKEGLSYDVVDRLSKIPRRGQEPQTVEAWKALYEAIRSFLEGDSPEDGV